VRRTPAAWIVPSLLLLATAARAGETPTLKVGDPAPKLFVSRWLNGDPVTELAKGTIYVVECWATWCGPCRASIPHVSELNTKVKDKGVVIIGLNVWEEDAAAVEPFLKKMGARMNYRVALDEGGKDGKSARAWLAASGQGGIPCAFVVDKEGTLAWIGHPMNGLDAVVEALIAGTFDPKKHAETMARRQENEVQIEAAFLAKEWDTLLTLLDKAAGLDPDAAAQISRLKVRVLLGQKKDYEAGYALAKALADKELKDDAPGLNELAWIILSDKGVEKRDLDLALKLALRADALAKHADAAILDTLARAHFEKGDLDKAIAAQAEAVAKAEDGAMKKDLTATLERYKVKKAESQ
jgi:thiol-disulfide isomerase/thioredoxin